jgi:hypothetical protein
MRGVRSVEIAQDGERWRMTRALFVFHARRVWPWLSWFVLAPAWSLVGSWPAIAREVGSGWSGGDALDGTHSLAFGL